MNDDPGKRGTPRAVTRPAAVMTPVYQRDAEAAQMRRGGATWDEIVDASHTWSFGAVPYASRAVAYNAVKARMVEARELSFGEAELYRQESLERLLELYKAARPLALAGSDKHLNVCARIIKQMGDLRGENLPIQVEIGMSDVDQLLRAAEQELGRRTAATQVNAARDEREAREAR